MLQRRCDRKKEDRVRERGGERLKMWTLEREGEREREREGERERERQTDRQTDRQTEISLFSAFSSFLSIFSFSLVSFSTSVRNGQEP